MTRLKIDKVTYIGDDENLSLWNIHYGGGFMAWAFPKGTEVTKENFLELSKSNGAFKTQ